jgi:hypothetical protein
MDGKRSLSCSRSRAEFPSDEADWGTRLGLAPRWGSPQLARILRKNRSERGNREGFLRDSIVSLRFMRYCPQIRLFEMPHSNG